MSCHLCGSENVEQFSTGKQELLWCSVCDLVFMIDEHILSPEQEKARYELHENSIENIGYVAFLRQLTDPLKRFITPRACILDYGSGPEPVMAELLHRDGYRVDIYDPFFAPEFPSENNYDAVTLSEVVEHFVYPYEEFMKVSELLSPGGVMGIMTLRYTHDTDFATWHYAHDPTHISFYSDKTFRWIENTFGFTCAHDDGSRVRIFQKR